MSTQAQLFPTAVAGGNGSGAPVAIPITDGGVDLAKKTVCIKVRLSTMCNTRKVSTSQIEADADKDLPGLEHLVDEQQEIRSFCATVTNFG